MYCQEMWENGCFHLLLVIIGVFVSLLDVNVCNYQNAKHTYSVTQPSRLGAPSSTNEAPEVKTNAPGWVQSLVQADKKLETK